MLDGVGPSKPAGEVLEFLSDDLNTPAAVNFLGHIGQVLFQKAGSKWEAPAPGTASGEWTELASEFVASAQLLGLLQPKLGEWTKTPDLHPLAKRLAEMRTAAMQTKDFAQVDRLKAALIEAGVEVRMSKEGVELVPGAGFDPSKLEALK